MSFDAGEIKAEATLDLSPFRRSVAQLRAEGKKIAAEKYTAKLDADSKGADADILDFKKKVKDATRDASTKLTVDNQKALADLEPVKARLDALRDRITTARVTTDSQKAKDRLDDLELTLRRIGRITSSPRVSLHGVTGAELQLDALELRLDRLGRSNVSAGGRGGRGGILGALGGLGSHAPGTLPLALGVAAPLVAPVAGLAAGAASSLLTPLVAGGIGGGVFSAVVKSQYAGLSTAIKTVTADEKAYNNATTSKSRAAALAKENRDWAALGPKQQKAAKNVHALSTEWSGFQKQLRPQSFGLIATGTDIARKGLKLLLPDVKAAGDTFDSLAKSADRGLNAPFWHQFFGTFLPGQTHSALQTLGTDLGKAATGLAHLTEDFAPLGNKLEADSVGWASKFEGWTEGKGPGKFVAWVTKNAPPAVHDLEQITKGIGGLVEGLDPLGQFELKAFEGPLTLLADLGASHPDVISAIGGSFLAVAVGLKAVAAVSGIAKTAGAVRTLVGAIKGGQGLKAGALSKALSGGGGMCGCGPGGAGGGAVKTAEKDAEEAAGGAGGAGLLARLGVGGSGIARLLSGLGAAGGAGLLAYQLSGTKDVPFGNGKVGVAPNGQQLSQAQFQKQYPLNTALGFTTGKSNLFPQLAKKFATSNLELDATNNSSGKIDYSKIVSAIVADKSPKELANLKALAAVYPQLQAAIDKVKGAQSALDKVQTASLNSSTLLGSQAKRNAATFAALDSVVQTKGSPALRGNTDAAKANRAALKDQADQLLTNTKTLVASGTSIDGATRKGASWARGLQASAQQVYGNKTAVDAYLKSIGALPSQVKSRIKVEGEKELAAVEAQINALHDKTVTLRIAQHGLGGNTTSGGPTHLTTPKKKGGGSSSGSSVNLGGSANFRDKGPPDFTGGQTAVPLTSTSKGSSKASGASATHKAASAKGPSATATANVLAGITDFAGLSFVSDLKSTTHAIQSGITQMIDRLNNAVRDKYLKGDTRLVAALAKSQKTLVGLARHETAVTKDLSKAQGNLSSLRSSASSLSSGTRSSFNSLGDLSQITTTPSSVAGLISIEGKQDKVGEAFSRNLAILRKKGLSKKQYDDLEQAGPGAAGNIVALLATATKSQIATVNKDTNLLQTLGISTGKASAGYVFGSKIAGAQKDVAADRAEVHKLVDLQRRTAVATEKLIKGGLKDDGTHKLLKSLLAAQHDSNRYLASLSGVSAQAKRNGRTTPARA